MLRGPPARALIITEIMEWAVRGGEMLDGSGPSPPRLATKTATQQPCPELHDHKIILVLCHPARSPLLAHSLTSLVPAPPANERNERRERASATERRAANDRNLPARSESSQIYRTDDVVRTTARQMTAGVIDRPDFARPALMSFLRIANRVMLPAN